LLLLNLFASHWLAELRYALPRLAVLNSEKIKIASHRLALPSLALPSLAAPCLAEPRHVKKKFLGRVVNPPEFKYHRLASPCSAKLRLAEPCLATHRRKHLLRRQNFKSTVRTFPLRTKIHQADTRTCIREDLHNLLFSE